jgi:hypothetical protein
MLYLRQLVTSSRFKAVFLSITILFVFPVMYIILNELDGIVEFRQFSIYFKRQYDPDNIVYFASKSQSNLPTIN